MQDYQGNESFHVRFIYSCFDLCSTCMMMAGQNQRSDKLLSFFFLMALCSLVYQAGHYYYNELSIVCFINFF